MKRKRTINSDGQRLLNNVTAAALLGMKVEKLLSATDYTPAELVVCEHCDVKMVSAFETALYTGLMKCRSDTSDDWALMGADGLFYLRLMPNFVCAETPERIGNLPYIGKLKNIRVYTRRAAATAHAVDTNCAACVGTLTCYCGVLISHSHRD